MTTFWSTLLGNLLGFAFGTAVSLILARPMTKWSLGKLLHQILGDPAQHNTAEWLAWVAPTGWLQLVEAAQRAEHGQPIRRPLPGGDRDPLLAQLRFTYTSIEPGALRDRPVQTSVTLGPRAARPLHLQTPLLLGCSYPPLSGPAWRALAWAAADLGSALRVGPEPLAGAPAPVTGPIWRATPSGPPLKRDALPEGFAAIELAASRWQHLLPSELCNEVGRWREASGGLPVALAVPATDFTPHWDRICASGADALVLDCAADALGSAGRAAAVQDGLAISPLVALRRMDEALREEGLRDRVSIVLAGRGLASPADFALALALGADAVAVDGIALWAMLERQLPKTLPWLPPSTLVSPAGRLRNKFNRRDATRRLIRYVTACTAEMTQLAKALGKLSLQELGPRDVISLDSEVAEALQVAWLGNLPYPRLREEEPIRPVRQRPPARTITTRPLRVRR